MRTDWRRATASSAANDMSGFTAGTRIAGGALALEALRRRVTDGDVATSDGDVTTTDAGAGTVNEDADSSPDR